MSAKGRAGLASIEAGLFATPTFGRKWAVFEKLSTDDISIAVDELIGCLGVKEETPCLDLLAYIGKRDTQECVQEIAIRLGLPIHISLSYVSKEFKAGNTSGFQSSSLSRTDWTGHGVEGITAQVCIPTSLPFFGSSSLKGYPISVRVSENCFERPETFIAVMAHELSHVLLRSLCHPKKDSELHTDLVPILLGFRDCVRRGRKNFQHTTTAGRTTTHTTTYGYLTDQQFEFACNKVTGILKPHECDKQHLVALTKHVRHKLLRTKKGLASFRECLLYLDTHLTAKITEKDAYRIVQFHRWDYTRDWEIGITQAGRDLEATDAFVRTLNHYTSSTIKQLREHTLSIDLESEQLDQLGEAIARDVKLLRRHVGLVFRLRRAIWSLRWGPEPITSCAVPSEKTQPSKEK